MGVYQFCGRSSDGTFPGNPVDVFENKEDGIFECLRESGHITSATKVGDAPVDI